MSSGLVSAMYTGTHMLAMPSMEAEKEFILFYQSRALPIPIPRMILPTRSTSLLLAAPMVMAPAVNITAAMMMAGFRPSLTQNIAAGRISWFEFYLSVMNPPTNEKRNAAPTVAAVIPDSQSSARSGNKVSFYKRR